MNENIVFKQKTLRLCFAQNDIIGGRRVSYRDRPVCARSIISIRSFADPQDDIGRRA